MSRKVRNIRNIINISVSVVFALLLVYYLMLQIKLDDVIFLFKGADIFILLIAFIAYVGSYWFRALRFKLALNVPIGLGRLFDIVSINTVLNNIMPARLGELSYVYLIKKQGIRGVKAISTLMVSRIFDLMVISIIFFVSVMFIGSSSGALSTSLSIVALFFGFLVLFLVLVIVLKKHLVKFIMFFVRMLKLENLSLVKYVLKKLSEVIDDLREMGFSGVLAHMFLLSFAVWVFQFLSLYLIILASGVNLGFLPLAIAITFSTLSAILPIYSPGGFGVIEGAWAIGLVIFGVSRDLAISTGFFQHIILIIFFAVLGLYSLLSLSLGKK